jgi:hypothetical protein
MARLENWIGEFGSGAWTSDLFQFLFYGAKLGFGVCCSFSEIARLKRFA